MRRRDCDSPDLSVHDRCWNDFIGDANRQDVIGCAFLARLIGFAEYLADLPDVFYGLSELELSEAVVGDKGRCRYTTGMNSTRVSMRNCRRGGRVGRVHRPDDAIRALAPSKQKQDTDKAAPHAFQSTNGEGSGRGIERKTQRNSAGFFVRCEAIQLYSVS